MSTAITSSLTLRGFGCMRPRLSQWLRESGLATLIQHWFVYFLTRWSNSHVIATPYRDPQWVPGRCDYRTPSPPGCFPNNGRTRARKIDKIGWSESGSSTYLHPPIAIWKANSRTVKVLLITITSIGYHRLTSQPSATYAAQTWIEPNAFHGMHMGVDDAMIFDVNCLLYVANPRKWRHMSDMTRSNSF